MFSSSVLIVAGLLGLAQAQSYTPPTSATFGSLYTPNQNVPATQGQTVKVTWDPTGTTSGETISLVLCHGPSTNCVNSPTAIVTGIPASQAYYNWAVPCSLAPGVQSTQTGYGMLIIVDGTGQFQYSTQFSVLAGSSCASSSSTTTSSSTTSMTSSMSSSSMSTTSSSSTVSGGPSTWLTWSASNNYTMTSIKPTGPSSVKVTSTAPATLTYASATSSATGSASPSPSLFHGAATKVGGSAAALVLAAGAALFAL